MSRNIKDLDPELQAKAGKAINEMKSSGELKKLGVEDIYISETKRELATQMAYYSRGRMKPEHVKKMYAAAGLYKISTAEAKVCNTQTLCSRHITGRAIDIYPVIKGNVRWNPPKAIWKIIGSIGKKYGMEWGGDWDGFKDYPHFQI